jgi:AraC-like DNA-binding protein
MLKLSPNYIGKIFKDYEGMSFSEYLNKFGVEKAAEWLINSDLEVNMIMLKVGMDSESTFYRIFKKYFVLSPREYVIFAFYSDLKKGLNAFNKPLMLDESQNSDNTKRLQI